MGRFRLIWPRESAHHFHSSLNSKVDPFLFLFFFFVFVGYSFWFGELVIG